MRNHVATGIVTNDGSAADALNSLEQYRDLRAQGLSQRQAANRLDVPRTTLQAWRAWQDRLDACPQVVEFF
jgi:hypothetical protein